MPSAFVLLRCIAKSAVKNVVNLFTYGVGGDILVDSWDYWCEASKEEKRTADVQALAAASPAEVAAAAAEIVQQEGSRLSEAERMAVTEYLKQVPPMIRRSMRRPADPEGKTIRPGATFRKPADLLPLLPPQAPRFKPGDRPLPGVDWELVELLGRGGFGEVWKACNPHFDGVAPVALKFCLDPAAKERLLKHEAKIINQVMRQGRHDGIVPLQHSYLSADPPCLAYEYVAGGELTGLIQEHAQAGGMAPPAAARILHRLAEIVGFAHGQTPPIVHRDLKPANVLVQAQAGGEPAFRIADFGIGGLAIQHARGESRHCSRSANLTSAVLGSYTLLYASPQQMAGDDPDPRDDVYALGVIWHQLLTGDLTKGRPGGEAWKKRLEQRGMSAPMLALLTATFEDERTDRPADGAVLAAKLRPLVGVESPRPRTASVPEPNAAPVESAPAAQATTPDLPPLPRDILELEQRLTSLQQTLESIEQGRHPDLAAAWNALEGHKAPDGSPVVEWMKREFEKDSSHAAAELYTLLPEALRGAALPVAEALQDQLLLKQEMERQLLARQEQDFLAIMRVWFAASAAADFPVIWWMKREPQLAARRYRFVASGRELFERAKAIWRSAWEERSAWTEAEASGAAEGYESFLERFPSSLNAAAARAKAAALLREKVIREPYNDELRRRYLRVRTPELLAKDRRISVPFGWLIAPLILTLLGIACLWSIWFFGREGSEATLMMGVGVGVFLIAAVVCVSAVAVSKWRTGPRVGAEMGPVPFGYETNYEFTYQRAVAARSKSLK